MELRLIVLIAVLARVNANSYFFAVAPNAFRYEHEETVLVNLVGTSNQNVEVWLEANGKEFSRTNVIVPSESEPMTVTVKVTEDDIFDIEKSQRAPYVTLAARCMGQTKKEEVLMVYDSGYLIIQTDKPIYSPGQKVQYRVLALQEDMQHAKDVPLAIDIIDSKNRTVRRQEVVWEDIPMFDDFFDIPKYADLERWTIRAFYRGQYNTQARTTFLVQEYELPTFGVDITIDAQCILETTGIIEVKVEGRYVYDKPVDGTVGLNIKLYNDEQDDLGDGLFLMSMGRQYLSEGVYRFEVNIKDVLKSPNMPARIQGFPGDGYYFEMRADITERVTGNEETGTQKIILADNPYIFKFDDSRETYRPSLVYTLQVEILHANGIPVDNVFAEIEMTNTASRQMKKEEVEVTNGKAMGSFSTDEAQGSPSLEFKVMLDGESSDVFSVQPYQGADQVHIEMVIHKGQQQLRVSGTAKDQSIYSGFILMILSKGSIVWKKYYTIKAQEFILLDTSLQELASPSARAVVYFIKKTTGEIVSDSTKFELTPRCRGKNGLKLSVDDKGNRGHRPGAAAKLNIEGESHMHVGINSIDTALLLLDDQNILKQNTMFKKMKQHDLGCGAGGGISSSDVFKRAGLVVLSNANIDNVKRQSISCDGNRRKKRSLDDCHSDKICCEDGYQYGTELAETNNILLQHAPELAEDLPPKCYAKALSLVDKDLTTVCLSEYLRYCLQALIPLSEDLVGKSIDDESDYFRDLKEWGDDIGPVVRKNFKDSWLFKYVKLDRDGKNDLDFLFPDSITTWFMQGIGFSSETGICIAEPIEVKVYRDLFIQLDLPYSAVRLENINIQATVFNYYQSEFQIRAYIEGQKQLCSNAVPAKQSPKQESVVAGNNATSFNFLVMPLQAGTYEIIVRVLAKAEGVYQNDGVSKKLLVKNEGDEELKTIHVCLDPLNQNKGCSHSEDDTTESFINGQQTLKVRLVPPPNAIPKTPHAIGYISSNIMTNVVEKVIQGTDKFIRMPWGCGEQTMIGLAPLVYAMAYLKQTKQVNEVIERNGNNYIRRGVERELGYRHDDYAYAAFKSRKPSTWLSAFVMKVFCQAKKVVDSSVNEVKDILPTLKYLLKTYEAGRFKEVLAVGHRSMMGQVSEHDLSLTAFVTISFLECDSRTPEMNATVLGAIQTLEKENIETLKRNPYHLALMTYALGMANSPKKWQFMRALKQIAQRDQAGRTFWGSPGNPASAQSIETTGYALLAYLNFRLDSESGDIVKWLIQQREAGGFFRSTQDTVVAIQALSAYNVRTYVKDVNLKVTITPTKGRPKTLTVTNENAQVMQVTDNLLQNVDETELKIHVEGTGSAMLDIDLTYNTPAEVKPCVFNVSIIKMEDLSEEVPIDRQIGEKRKCDVCSKCDDPEVVDYDQLNAPKIENQRRRKRASRKPRFTHKKYCVRFSIRSEVETSGMSIVKFGLQTGMSVIKNDIDILMKDYPSIARYELPADGKGYIIFYLMDLEETIDFTFRLEDGFLGDPNTRQMAKLEVYEYYDPDRTCSQFYGVGQEGGDPLPYECKDDKAQSNCICLQNVCAEDFNEKYRTYLRRGRAPVVDLYKRICIRKMADYAVLVRIDTRQSNADTKFENATATVLNVIHRGDEPVTVKDKMFFRWFDYCANPDLEVGKKYYIVAKDGYEMTGADGVKRYVNELMDPSVVIEKVTKGKLKAVMERFTKYMKRGCRK